MKRRASPSTSRSRDLRRRQTDAERLLWARLRDRRLVGAKFRRQHPIGRFIADFACPELGLVVELDGGQHSAQSKADARRTDELSRHGYRVLRFWDNDVLKSLESVLGAILAEVISPSPLPSPAQGRGNEKRTKTALPLLSEERVGVRSIPRACGPSSLPLPSVTAHAAPDQGRGKQTSGPVNCTFPVIRTPL